MSDQTDQQDYLWGGTETLLARLKARGRPRPKTVDLDDPDLLRRLTGECVGYDDGAEPKRHKPPRTIPENADPEAMLTMAQAAARLNITTEQVKAFVDDNLLKYVNLGRGPKRPRYRFKPTEIIEFISARTRQEHQPCPSIGKKSRPSSTHTTSSSTVVGFLDRLAARQNAKPRK